MRRWLYLSALAVLAALLVLTPTALAQDQYEEEVVPEILEEQTEDPQEPTPENVVEGEREAALEEQVEARQGAELSPWQEAALEWQAEAGNWQPKELPQELSPREEAALEEQAEAGYQQPKELPKEKGVAKKEEKALPKTGGVSVGASVLGLGGSALLVGGGLLVLNRRNP
jgi:LPXTG-motif cell wall-anchored protein